jgi:indolepyruvate ferredoxin oxidoreductase beta subunit
MMMEYNILVSSVGGQGGITLARVISHAAMSMGLNVRVGETLGMAQRGGSVQSHVRLGDAVLGALIPEGRANVVISLEPAETLRVIKYMSPQTTVLMNNRPVLPISVLLNETAYPDLDEIEGLLQKMVGGVYAIDAFDLAEKSGTSRSLNVVMLGAYMALGDSALTLDAVKDALKETLPHRYLEQNMKAFKMGMEEMKKAFSL